MDTAKRTHRDIIRFINVATNWQQGEVKDSRLKYAVARVLKSCRKANVDCEEELTRINIERASTDDKGNIMTKGDGTFIFNPANLQARNKEQREILDAEVEVGIYFARQAIEEKTKKTIPYDLNALEEEVFAGFVIPELTEPIDEPAEPVPPAPPSGPG